MARPCFYTCIAVYCFFVCVYYCVLLCIIVYYCVFYTRSRALAGSGPLAELLIIRIITYYCVLYVLLCHGDSEHKDSEKKTRKRRLGKEDSEKKTRI
jgi:hypothetical protein